MKKRIIAVISAAVLIMLTLVSCSDSPKSVMNISGAQVTEGVYTYFYDYVCGNTKSLGIDLEADDAQKQLREKTVELLSSYVAVNSMAAKLKLPLSYTLRAQTAQETDSRWELYGRYYSSIGMTKQDLNKVLTSSALRSALLDYYYGEDSKIKPTKTESLKSEFVKKYVGVNVIAASLTTTDNLGNTVVLDTYELSSIRNVFNGMRERLNGGADISSVYSDYITNLDLIGTQSLETYVMTSSSVGFGDDFFSKISELSYNKAVVLEYEDTIYLAYRIDISSDDLGYFVTYKNDILEEMCMSKLEKKIASEAKKYVVLKEKHSATDKVRDTINKKHSI